MNCPNYVLNEDGERVCQCGDEGRLCVPCAGKEARYWLEQYLTSTLFERDPERYRRELIEAGRGHLVKP